MSDHTPFFPENLADYAPWVAEYGLLAPYGECQCGCGQKTNIAIRSRKEYGWKIHHPRRYISTHSRGKQTFEASFWHYVVRHEHDECWGWTGYTSRYGYFCFRYVDHLAHRASWEIHYGPIPDGLYVCHRCDNPPCTNPDHLFLGTIQDNHADMISKGRQPRGETHPSARLSEKDVRYMRDLYSNGISQSEISRILGLSTGLVQKIVTRKRWAHIP